MDDIWVRRRNLVVQKKGGSSNQKSNQKFQLGLVAFILLMSVSVINAQSTISYFSDIELASANMFGAGTLHFTVDINDQSNADISVGPLSGTTTVPIMTPAPGSFPIEYKIKAEKTSGSDDLCNALQVSATTTPFIYSGPLLLLNTGTTTIPGPWPLDIGVTSPTPPGINDGDTCSVDLVYSGFTEGGSEGIEYHDEERVSLTIHFALPPTLNIQSFDVVVQEDTLAPEGTSTPEATSTSESTSTPPISPENEETVEGTTTDQVTTPEVEPETTPEILPETAPAATETEGDIPVDIPL